jgi:hypothetical protein
MASAFLMASAFVSAFVATALALSAALKPGEARPAGRHEPSRLGRGFDATGEDAARERPYRRAVPLSLPPELRTGSAFAGAVPQPSERS